MLNNVFPIVQKIISIRGLGSIFSFSSSFIIPTLIYIERFSILNLGLNISKPDISGNRSEKISRRQNNNPDSNFQANKKFKHDQNHTNKNINRQRRNNAFGNTGPFGNIVLVEHSQENSIGTLTNAVNASGQNLEWIYDESPTGW